MTERDDMSSSNLANGGKILVDQLVAEGVDRAFGVPGESYLAVLDALHEAALATGLFDVDGIRTRAVPRTRYTPSQSRARHPRRPPRDPAPARG